MNIAIYSRINILLYSFIKIIFILSVKQEYVFSNRSFFDVFLDFSSIYIVNEDYESDDIDSSVHDCIIFENSCYQNFNEEKFDNEATFDEKEYELRLILCINYLSDIHMMHVVIVLWRLTFKVVVSRENKR